MEKLQVLIFILKNHSIDYRVDSKNQLFAYTGFTHYLPTGKIYGLLQENITGFSVLDLKKWLQY